MNKARARAKSWALFITLSLAVACSGERTAPTVPELSNQDAALVRAVEQAGGRVMIGFKNAGASRGVDAQGRVLASAASIAAGKAFLRTLELTIDYEFQKIPGVIVTIDPALVPTIRRHPNVDYLEVSTSGSWPVVRP